MSTLVFKSSYYTLFIIYYITLFSPTYSHNSIQRTGSIKRAIFFFVKYLVIHIWILDDVLTYFFSIWKIIYRAWNIKIEIAKISFLSTTIDVNNSYHLEQTTKSSITWNALFWNFWNFVFVNRITLRFPNLRHWYLNDQFL